MAMSKIERDTEISRMIREYLNFKRVQGLKESTLTDMHNRITRVCRDCRFNSLADINGQSCIDFFAGMLAANMSPNTLKVNIQYSHQFFEWLIARGSLAKNPLDNCPRPKNFRRNLKKRRRALTEEELRNLIKVAALRPLAEITRRKSNGFFGPKDKYWRENRIDLENIELLAKKTRDALERREVRRLEMDGRKWALTWTLLAYTGLRWGELKSVKVKQFTYGPNSSLHLKPEQTKNSYEAVQPVPLAVATQLHQWILDRDLYANDPIIPDLPDKGIPRFRLDAEAAGIEREDKLGRTIDIHCLRYTYCTLLAKAGVNMRLVQKLMRHQCFDMTMRIYTDAEQLDYSGAVEVLNDLALMGTDGAPPKKPTPKPEASPAPASGQGGGLPSAMAAQLVGAMDADAMKAALIALLSKPAQE